jgi:hypothetical protein
LTRVKVAAGVARAGQWWRRGLEMSPLVKVEDERYKRTIEEEGDE